MRPGSSHRRGQNGFTLLAALAAMFVLGLGTQVVLTSLSQQAQRERELQLLRVGVAYARAIRDYYEMSPGAVKRWPSRLEDLANDTRFVGIQRHIRQLYKDPVEPSASWVLVRAPDGGIAGVHSVSSAAPIQSAAQEFREFNLPSAVRYSDWQFVYLPPTPTLAPGGSRR